MVCIYIVLILPTDSSLFRQFGYKVKHLRHAHPNRLDNPKYWKENYLKLRRKKTMFFCISALLYTVFTLFWSFCTWFPFFWWILYGQFEIDHIWGQLWTVYETQKLTVCKEKAVWLYKHDISEGEICTQQDSVQIVFLVKVGGQTKLRELNMYIYILFTFLIIEFSSTEDHESYISKGSE